MNFVNTSAFFGPMDPGWWHDADPGTTCTFATSSSSSFNFDLDPATDFAEAPGLTGWRVELDVVSGSGQLFLYLAFDDTSPTSSYVAFETYFDIAGPGTVVVEMGDPSFIGDAGGHTYTPGDLYELLRRVIYVGTEEEGDDYNHGYGDLEAVYNADGPDIVVSEFRIIFFTEAARLRVLVDPEGATEEDRWKFFVPKPGENAGFGVGKILTPDGWVIV